MTNYAQTQVRQARIAELRQMPRQTTAQVMSLYGLKKSAANKLRQEALTDYVYDVNELMREHWPVRA